MGCMKAYKNPFLLENQWSEFECGDPYVMRFNGMYYLYCSSAGDHIKCWQSEDLVNFEYVGSVCDDPMITGAYAPEVTYYKGRFYMITSPKGSGHYILEAMKPTGPFNIVSDNYGLLIDGSYFVDDDGKQYMLRAGHKGIVIHSMPSPYDIDVNGTTISEAYLNYWTEGPMIIKRNGLYYLTYTGNHLLSKGYRIAYSVSDKAPDKGYVNLRNHTLLIETDPEFHALGHSSSFLAPDLDSYCIAYHNFDLDSNPRRRSSNIDRLFFNGARMYSNPIWWEQPAHRMPEFYCRNQEELQSYKLEEDKYLVTSKVTPKTYTAEWNVNPKNNGVCLIYGLNDEQYGSIHLNNNRSYQISEKGIIKASGILNDAISFDGIITIRFIRMMDCTMEIFINNMFLCEYRTGLGEGKFGILQNDQQEIGFVAFSACTQGEQDKFSYKAIPGRFDAIHCREEIEKIAFKDAGLTVYGGYLKKEKQYSYSVNVRKTGEYKLVARIKEQPQGQSKEGVLTIITDHGDNSFEVKLTGICDQEGYQIVTVGNLCLDQGLQQITAVTSCENFIVDYFQFIESSSFCSLEVIKEGTLVADCMQIMGHKKQHSLIHKYSGFTCAEGHGMGFIGDDGMSDYKVSSIIHRNHCNTGDLSIYVRVTKESWFGPQVNQALFGYRIQITVDGIYLYKESYDEKQLAFYSLDGIIVQELKLSIEAIESRILISIDDRVVINYVDPEPYLYGKVGIEATREGFGFKYFSICI